MRGPREAVRALALAVVMLVLAATVWVCLIGAAVVLMADWLGTGLALLVVAGGLVVLLAIILLVANAACRERASQRVVPGVLAQGALSAVSHPLAIRGILLLAGVALALSAVLIPGGNPKDKGPPS